MPTLEQLAESWGVAPLRSEQSQIIQALLQGQDVLGVLPTGYGKSVCYQLPALIFPGMTLVLSPLLALMFDQVQQLQQRGVAAAAWNSSLTATEKRHIAEQLRQGSLRILYCAPESLRHSQLQSLLSRAHISHITVDEAHCISEWGQSFRPEYRAIPLLLEKVLQNQSRPVQSAFTATATTAVIQDIQTLLHLRRPYRCLRASVRTNLTLRREFPLHEAAKRTLLLQWIARWEQQHSGLALLYVGTRNQAEFYARWLHVWGTPAVAFHGGRSSSWRQRCLQQLRQKPFQCVVATSAFGMGVDLPHIRLVIHLFPSSSLAAYAQEAGRAGRDGDPATAVFLYRPEDWEVVLPVLFAHKNAQQQAWTRKQAQALHFWINGKKCLRKNLADHFVGEAHPDAFQACRCSVCWDKKKFDEQHVTVLGSRSQHRAS